MAAILCPATNANGVAQTSNQTLYFAMGTTTIHGQSTESNALIAWRTAGTFSNMYCRIGSNTVTATTTITFRKNTAAGNQTISIPSSTTGEFSDSTHTDTVVAGDTVDYQVVIGATGTSISFLALNTVFTATSGTVLRFTQTNASAVADSTASSTLFAGICGPIKALTSTEANTQFKVKAAFTLQNFYTKITANTKVTTSTVGSRKNGGIGNLIVSVPALTTGVFEDLTHSDSLVSGDLINYYLTQGAGATSISVLFLSAELASATNQNHCVAADQAGASAATGTGFFPIGGDVGATTSTTAAQSSVSFGYTASNLECFISTNAAASPKVLSFQKNGVDGNQTISIPAGTTGYFEDTVNSDVVSATQELRYQLINAGGPNIVFRNLGHLVTVGSVAVKYQAGLYWSYPV